MDGGTLKHCQLTFTSRLRRSTGWSGFGIFAARFAEFRIENCKAECFLQPVIGESSRDQPVGPFEDSRS